MNTSNKEIVVNAVWENPERLFGCPFRSTGNKWESMKGGKYQQAGALRLLQKGNGTGITVCSNHGSGIDKGTFDVFTFAEQYITNTTGFKETLRAVAELYGITLQFSAQERAAINRAALANEIAATLVEALRQNPQGPTAQYLNQRGIKNDNRHFGELTVKSIGKVKDSLSRRGIPYNINELKALGITQERAEKGFSCVMPYYHNGNVRGFVYRNILPDAKDRYRYSEELGRNGYCERLTVGQPVVVVEGQFDAIQLMQRGVKNVLAVGGAEIGADIARFLHTHNITELYYIPDREYDEQGEQKTNLILKMVKKLTTIQDDGEQVVNTLYVAELPEPNAGTDLTNYKIDTADWCKDKTEQDVTDLLADGVAWWSWELNDLYNEVLRQAADGQGPNIGTVQKRFDEIYSRCNSSYERERIKDYIAYTDGTQDVWQPCGITPDALRDIDSWRKNIEYNARLQETTKKLQQAVEVQANPETVGKLINELRDAQAANDRDEWSRQINETFADTLQVIKEQPDTIQTKWEVGNIDKERKYRKYGNIEFYPADITVFAAQTSHGKTAVLFQAVMDLLAKDDGKTYLYVSCEENKRQLTERALNVFIDIPVTENGKDENGAYCFKTGTRRKTIKAAIRQDLPPYEYETLTGEPVHYIELCDKINAEVERYGREIHPRLKLIHTDGTAESICNNIQYCIEQYRQQGVEVGGVFIDYVQLLTTASKNYSRHDELKVICKELKDLAASTELPVIIAAQLNREGLKEGIDTITAANLGEGADIERIAHDLFLVWQVDKTKTDLYTKVSKDGEVELDTGKLRTRSQRLFTRGSLGRPQQAELKRGYLYIEQLKARDGRTEGWGLFPFDGERGHIGSIDKDAMTQ